MPQRTTNLQALTFLVAAVLLLAGGAAHAQEQDVATLSRLLPPSVAQSVDLNAWGWIYDRRAIPDNRDSYWDVDLSLGVTKRFGERVAGTVDFHFIDADDHLRGFLEQAFVSVKLSESAGTILTVGKFNASFGVESRNAWDRFGGTTSLLFGAEPQDLVGIMITQPLGETAVTIKPFVTSDFEGRSDFIGPPSAGISIEYRPRHELGIAVTNWVGPGLNHEEYPSPEGEYQGATAQRRDSYPAASASEYSSGYGYSVVDNWMGPSLHTAHNGTFYFIDAKITWLPRPDLTVAAEGLIALNGPSGGNMAWAGLLVLANFDLTDRWRFFGRWSFLDDAQGIVTDVAQRRHELSGGVGYEILRGLELRGEYRHDFSNTAGDLDGVSVHLTFSY